VIISGLIVGGVTFFSPQPANGFVQVISSDSKIGFTRYTGFWAQQDQPAYFTFNLINLGNETATKIGLIPSSLIASEGSTFSLAPSYIGSDMVNAYASANEIAPNDSITITYELRDEFLKQVGLNEVTYIGQIQVVEGNSEPIEIDVESSFRDNPWSYFVIAWLGIGLALIFAYLHFRWEKARELEQELDDDVSIIEHINAHIKSINHYKDTIIPQAWHKIEKDYSIKLESIVRDQEHLSLVKDDEAVVWFENLDNFIRQRRMFVKPSNTTNTDLPEVAQLTEKNRIQMKKLRMKEELKSTLAERKKWVYVLVISLVAAISAVVAAASFAGNSWLNAIVAISIGFVIYRAQDVFSAIRQ
jgi:hypothetical protein